MGYIKTDIPVVSIDGDKGFLEVRSYEELLVAMQREGVSEVRITTQIHKDELMDEHDVKQAIRIAKEVDEEWDR